MMRRVLQESTCTHISLTLIYHWPNILNYVLFFGAVIVLAYSQTCLCGGQCCSSISAGIHAGAAGYQRTVEVCRWKESRCYYEPIFVAVAFKGRACSAGRRRTRHIVVGIIWIRCKRKDSWEHLDLVHNAGIQILKPLVQIWTKVETFEKLNKCQARYTMCKQELLYLIYKIYKSLFRLLSVN